ncbi:MAG: inositol-3-phosphate synthase [Deltaproteobacteria bacterium]|nr:inositol-3-phosphate synthase [Deltaproteobacteria bacterium]
MAKATAARKTARSAAPRTPNTVNLGKLTRTASDEKKKLGKLAILLVGCNGAIATTVQVGIELFKRGLADADDKHGMLSQTGTIRIGARDNFAKINDIVSVADFGDMVVGGWDINRMDAYEAARYAKVLDPALVDQVKGALKGRKPMPGYFENAYVKNLKADIQIKAKNKMKAAEQIMKDIQTFMKKNRCDRAVVVYVGSTERYHEVKPVHQTLAAFEKGLVKNSPDIAPSQVYIYAAFRLGVPHHNFSPSQGAEIPALRELARKNNVPFSGNDGKTGQTWMKSVIMPGFKGKELKIMGWASNNWIGNKDGLVLDEPGSFQTKKKSKSNQAANILGYEIEQPVLISYYKIAGDDKHALDRVDFQGFLGYPMIIDFSFFCRDSILAAPMVIDLARFLDWARRKGMGSVQEWLGLYSKSPQPVAEGVPVQHDFFVQREKFENTIRELVGAPIITHLGDEYWQRGS